MLRRSACRLGLQVVECPRDAMQGLKEFVPTEDKIRYINALLGCNFHTVDFGSFVPPRSVPQMADTLEVLDGLDMSRTKSKLLAVVANIQGAQNAAKVGGERIHCVGYPLSISETFQQRNTNRSREQALEDLKEICEIAGGVGQELVVYLSMAFGNPYEERYDSDIVAEFIQKVRDQLPSVTTLSLADTTGNSTPELIQEVFSKVLPLHPDIVIGAHFHSKKANSYEKVSAAVKAGVQRLDGAFGGLGGCPFAKDSLTGNVQTEAILKALKDEGLLASTGIDKEAVRESGAIAESLFGVTVDLKLD